MSARIPVADTENPSVLKDTMVRPSCCVSVCYLLSFAISFPFVLLFLVFRFLPKLFVWPASCCCSGRKRVKVQPGDGFTLLTGASSGIGKKIAEQLAKKGHNLIIVSRRRPQLEVVRDELLVLNKDITVHVITSDLCKLDAAKKLVDEIAALGVDVSILINNAGIGCAGPFV